MHRMIRPGSTACAVLLAIAMATGCKGASDPASSADEFDSGAPSDPSAPSSDDTSTPSESGETTAVDDSSGEGPTTGKPNTADDPSQPNDATQTTDSMGESGETVDGSATGSGSGTANGSEAGAGETGDVTDSGGETVSVDDSDGSETTAPAETSVPHDGVQTPDMVVAGSEEYSAGLEARDSNFGKDSEGEIRWLFTVENTTDETVCADQVDVKLYDADDNVIAGNGPGLPDGDLPIFTAAFTGSPYRNGPLVTTCIAPGERGVGRGAMLSLSGSPLDADDILERGARIEYFFSSRFESSDYVPAPELLTVTASKLTQTDAGAVVGGTALNGEALIDWTIHAALYDASGLLIDFVSTDGAQWAEGEDLSFELPPGSPEATGYELYYEMTIWQ